MGLIEIKFDGACKNVKGESSIMGIGVAVFFDGDYIEEESIAIQVVAELIRGTSNISEWEGCIEAWKKAIDLNKRYPGNKIEIYSDSQVISCQFNGTYAINEPSFLSYYEMGKALQEKLPEVTKVNWIKRDFNKEADVLSKLGLKVGLISRAEVTNQNTKTNM